MSTPLAPLQNLRPEHERLLQELSELPYLERRRELENQGEVPLDVYRYIRPGIPENHLAAYLLDSFFWLKSPSDFNDPFDTSAYSVLDEDVNARRSHYKKMVKLYMPNANWRLREKEVNARMCDPEGQLVLMRGTFNRHIGRLGVLCFSEDNLNLLMWSHYADNHKGFTLQFDLAQDVKTMLRISKVDYSNDYPLVNLNNLAGDDAIRVVFLRKFEGWKYEREWRMVVPNGANTYLPFESRALTGLTFGCRAGDDFKQRILAMLKKRAEKGLLPIEVKKTVKHHREYRLMIEREVSLPWPIK